MTQKFILLQIPACMRTKILFFNFILHSRYGSSPTSYSLFSQNNYTSRQQQFTQSQDNHSCHSDHAIIYNTIIHLISNYQRMQWDEAHSSIHSTLKDKKFSFLIVTIIQNQIYKHQSNLKILKKSQNKTSSFPTTYFSIP